MGNTYPSSLSLKKNFRVKHVRSANWVAPTCPQGMFLIFWKGEAIGWCKHAPKGRFLLFSRVWGLISYQVPKQFPSITYQNPFVSHQVSNNSHQIPLVFINNPSKSFCSHRVPKNSLVFPSVTRQNPFVFIKFPSNSFCFHQVPIKFFLFPSSSHQLHIVPINFILFPTPPYIYPHKALNFVRDSGRVQNGAPSSWAGRKGSSSGRQTSAARGRAERRDILPARSCGRSRVDLLLARQSAVLLPSCACGE
jgi:hypothetical protein